MVVTPRPFKPIALRPTQKLANRLAEDHVVQWRTASPLWADAAENSTLGRPEILRFTTDTFMEDFLKVATQTPERLGEWKATPETWRLPAPIPPLPPNNSVALADPDAAELSDEPLKLFQSTHQRYYLVTANLVCRTPGFPDRMLKTNNDEQVSFVLRRFLSLPSADDNATPVEHALVDGKWQQLLPTEEQQLLSGEQQFPLFPTTYIQAGGYRRRLFSGLIPVGARETYMNAARKEASPEGSEGQEAGPDASAASQQQRIEQLLTVLELDVIQPWRAVNQQRILAERKLDESLGDIYKDVTNTAKAEQDALDSIHEIRDGLQTASWYILLDFAYYLERYFPQLWSKILGNSSISLGSAEQTLLEALEGVTYKPYIGTPNTGSFNTSSEKLKDKFRGINSATGVTTIAAALKSVYETKDDLEKQTATYPQAIADTDWPDKTFLLCSRTGLPFVTPGGTSDAPIKRLISEAFQDSSYDRSLLDKRIPMVPISQQISETTEESDYSNDEFIIRCVFERPHCPSSVHPTVVSEPTRRFRLASFFDPDAPSRPIRIPMPLDTSPSGLRKFAKNTAFVLSDSLSCQLEKTGSLTFGDLVLSVLPWPFKKKFDTSGAACSGTGTINFGKICTLSIPIITICALILLMIIVQLLDIIFRWVPYLIFCLPLPGLKSKEE